jgi:putative acetyltransferase
MDMRKWRERIGKSNPFVAVADGILVGFAELEPNGHIDYFYCHHEWQGKGVGTAIYRELEKEALRNGIRRLFAEVSMTAKEFFLKMGFVITEERSRIICDAPAKNFMMEKMLPLGYSDLE